VTAAGDTTGGGGSGSGNGGTTSPAPAACSIVSSSITSTSFTFEVICLGGSSILGDFGNATTSLGYYGTVNQPPDCTVYGGAAEACDYTFTYQLAPTAPSAGSASAAQASALAQITPAAPTFAGSVPSTTANAALPYVYTDYPVQVSLGNVPATIGPITTTSQSAYTEGGNTVTLTIAASVTGSLTGFHWTTQGAETDDTNCGPDQNSLSTTNDNQVADPSIYWTQRSDAQGWPLSGYATYAASGTVTATGPFGTLNLVDGPIGSVNTAAVTTNMPVAELESVNCDPSPVGGNC
jgi:hypothetical protein